jgi:hypothetical protein
VRVRVRQCLLPPECAEVTSASGGGRYLPSLVSERASTYFHLRFVDALRPAFVTARTPFQPRGAVVGRRADDASGSGALPAQVIRDSPVRSDSVGWSATSAV